MHELLVAVLVGLSLGNSWLCLFLAFSVSAAESRTGMWFLVGRTIGLVVLGFLIVFAGLMLDLSPKLMQGAAGVLAVVFGGVLIGGQIWRKRMEERGETRVSHDVISKTKDEGRGSVDHVEVMHDGGSCEHHSPKKYHQCNKRKAKDEGRLHDGDVCTIRDDLERIDKSSKRTSAFGFGLGVFRGVTPCFKIVVLAPLLVAVPVGSAVLMVLVFTAVSMVYPIIGYLSANTLHNLIRNRKLMMLIGGFLLIIIGVYYIYESAVTYGVHVPGGG